MLDTPAPTPAAHRVWTIGHSNRTIDELLDLLIANEIEVVGDTAAARVVGGRLTYAAPRPPRSREGV